MHFLRYLIVIFLLLLGVQAHAQKSKSLTAKFTFNNGSLLNEVNGKTIKAYSSAFVPDRFGNPNSACMLQGGEGSYLNLGSGDELKPLEGTVSMWVNISHPMSHGKGCETNPIFLTRSSADLDYNSAIYIGYDYLTKNLNVNTTLSKEKQITIYSPRPFTLRTWHHVAMTYDKNYLKLYLDGVLESTMTKGFASVFLKGDSVLIGSLNTAHNKRYFHGLIDDIEIHNKVLNDKQIRALFNDQNPNKTAILLKWLMISCASLLFISGIVYGIRRRIRYMVQQEKERNQLFNHALEQEVKMLKAQMDPHFIFNSLNTILQFIITNENRKAELYLTKFSKLIRKLLESNTHESISLDDELDILKKYLEIESLRFDKVFSPSIMFGPGIDSRNTYIPHMLIQPFIENAIWHGLRLKEGEKKLSISFELLNDRKLLCVIDDNGIGRKKEGQKPGAEKNSSLAINFIKQRLELMSKKYNEDYSVEIIDKLFENGEVDGTRVELIIPILKR